MGLMTDISVVGELSLRLTLRLRLITQKRLNTTIICLVLKEFHQNLLANMQCLGVRTTYIINVKPEVKIAIKKCYLNDHLPKPTSLLCISNLNILHQ